MRILNFVFNAEIKYQQHINSENYNIEIFRLTTTMEKPTRGKPVKERFLLFRSFREILLQHVHLQKFNDKLISIIVPSLHTGR
jgi:hypothetical protein